MEMEMSVNDDVRIDIPDTQLMSNSYSLVKEWEGCLRGHESTKRYERKRHIGKLPPLLLKGEKGHINREYYEPAVVSLGPYHHNRTELAQAEKYKLITLKEFQLSSEKSISSIYNKVFEVVHDARKCYIDGSTDEYNDEAFNRMMTRDGCFILFFIDCISCGINKVLLHNEYLGALGFANVVRDIFLLEDQIPFVVLEVLLDLRFPDDKGEEILNKFFNYLNYGESMMRDEKVLENKLPLHLLELYRSYFISLSPFLNLGSTKSSKWHIWAAKETYNEDEDYNYVKLNRSFLSVKELKSKGTFLKRSYEESSNNEDIEFHSRGCYGVLKLVRRAVSSISKVLYLNMIAYEMCPHNPNDFRVSTYIRIMKSLVVHIDDVRELRNNDVLVHSLGGDEQVVKMYADIEAPTVNIYMFSKLRSGIDKHCSSKYKTGWAEVFDVYFSSPWKTIASLAAVSILLITGLQTYFTINPLPKPASI